MANKDGWIGVDLDGTLAEYHGWKGADHIGPPIPAMAARVRQWVCEGKRVKIFTARVYHDGTLERMLDALKARNTIERWSIEHLGGRLEVTNVKDFAMIELWDDRAVRVGLNSGEPVLYEESEFQHG